MDGEPPEKRFWMVPFSIHATRGLLRDRYARRKTISISVVVAVVMLTAGLTILRPWLEPHQHPFRFVLFWLVCAWMTVLVLLLALFDLLLIRAQARDARKTIQKKFADETAPVSQDEPEL